jgi:hypothetical protein
MGWFILPASLAAIAPFLPAMIAPAALARKRELGIRLSVSRRVGMERPPHQARLPDSKYNGADFSLIYVKPTSVRIVECPSNLRFTPNADIGPRPQNCVSLSALHRIPSHRAN